MKPISNLLIVLLCIFVFALSFVVGCQDSTARQIAFERKDGEKTDDGWRTVHIYKHVIPGGATTPVATFGGRWGGLTVSPRGDMLAALLFGGGTEPTRVRVMDATGKITYETAFSGKETYEMYEMSFSPDSKLLAVIIGEDDRNEMRFTSTGLAIVDLQESSVDWLIEAVGIDDRPSNWYRTSIDSLNWWMRDVLWMDDSTLLALSTGSARVFNVRTGELLWKFEIDWDCTEGGTRAHMLSADGRYLFFDLCIQRYSRESEMLYDLKERKFVTGFSEVAFGPGIAPEEWIVSAKWMGESGSKLLIEMRPGVFFDETVGYRRPRQKPVHLRLIDVSRNVLVTEALDSKYSVEVEGNWWWTLPRYNKLVGLDSVLVPFSVDLLNQ